MGNFSRVPKLLDLNLSSRDAIAAWRVEWDQISDLNSNQFAGFRHTWTSAARTSASLGQIARLDFIAPSTRAGSPAVSRTA